MITLFFNTFLFKKRNRPYSIPVVTLLVLLCMPFLSYAKSTSAQQKQLQKKISETQSTLSGSRSVSNQLEKTVQLAEKKLHNISKGLYNTEQNIHRLTTKLTKSHKERSKLLLQTNQQKNALVQQMQALFTSGKQSHLRLLLKQDDPSDISRTFKYFEYMNQHRLKRIGLFKARLGKIDTLQTKISEDSTTLKALREKQHDRKASLKNAVKSKEKAYDSQKKLVSSQEQKLAKLRKQELRLEGVIQNLAKKREREALQRKQARAKKEVAKAPRHYISNKPFSALRGELSWPVHGKLTRKFGSFRNSQQRWKGVTISAPAGTQVRAIARGKIEFSGNLEGYGYLLIVIHDKNYLSLYAHNRSIYKVEGDIVEAGDVIAVVGNSGGQSSSGLYFEIRKNNLPQNPSQWIR